LALRFDLRFAHLWQLLRQVLTDFNNFCAAVTRNKFVTKRSNLLGNTILLCPKRREGLLLSVRLSVCPSVAYIANNSRTQRPSVPKFRRKVTALDATHTSVSRSYGQRSGLQTGGGIRCRPNPAATMLVNDVINTSYFALPSTQTIVA